MPLDRLPGDLQDGGEGLVDQLRLIVFPLLLGGGARLFDDWAERTSLRLVASRTFSRGVVLLAYEPEK